VLLPHSRQLALPLLPGSRERMLACLHLSTSISSCLVCLHQLRLALNELGLWAGHDSVQGHARVKGVRLMLA
jgi:hypothetical protein